MSPILYEQRRVARYSGPSDRLPFWFVLGKQNEHIKKLWYLFYLLLVPADLAEGATGMAVLFASRSLFQRIHDANR